MFQKYAARIFRRSTRLESGLGGTDSTETEGQEKRMEVWAARTLEKLVVNTGIFVDIYANAQAARSKDQSQLVARAEVRQPKYQNFTTKQGVETQLRVGKFPLFVKILWTAPHSEYRQGQSLSVPSDTMRLRDEPDAVR